MIPSRLPADPVKPRALLLLLLAIATACAGSSRPGGPAGGASNPTQLGAGLAGELSRDLAAFAADSMRGRETGTADGTRAAFFLGARLAALGLEPVGDSLYYQRVPLTRQVVAPTSRVTVTQDGAARSLRLGVELAPMISLGEGQPDPRRTVNAEIVFAGYGMTSRALDRDDFRSIVLLDRVAVILHGAPPGVTGALKDSLDSDSELSEQLARVALKQPAAIVILMTEGAARLYRQLYPSLMRDVRLRGAPPQPMPGLEIPMLLFGLAEKGSPFLPADWPADDRAQPLTGRALAVSIDVRRESFVGYNVMGRVPGTDPALRGSYVALGAHYDHVGIVPPVDGDSIANGADDDGSGSVALLAVAKAMMARPARRSTLFVWHVGEEKGLLGSGYFMAHPTVPRDSIVAQLNADMIGRNAPDQLYVVGPRAAGNAKSRRLGEIVDSTNGAQPAPFVIDRSWDDASHPDRIYQRSDHFNYARQGIPIVFFTTGMHADYHGVGDEASRIDYRKLARVTQLLLEVARAIGNSPFRPE
jgi:hypothetical protein